MIPLYYGPQAKDYIGHLKSPNPFFFGMEGLKVDESREILDLVDNPPIGSKGSTILIGPLESATIPALDALLKTLEEPPRGVSFVLWASDIGSVRETVRSRCIPHYIASFDSNTPIGDLEQDLKLKVEAALQSAQKGYLSWMVSILDLDPQSVLQATCELLAGNPSLVTEQQWFAFKDLLHRPQTNIYHIIEWYISLGQ